MHKGDVRAVENPITAIFDLAEDVGAQSPKIRIAIRYARVVIAFGLFINAILILVLADAREFALLLTFAIFIMLFVRRWLSDVGSRSVLFALAITAGVFDVLAFRGSLFFGLILVPFFFLGLVTMGYLREISEFFDYYTLRHRIVKSVRDADPVAHIPDGTDATQRLLRFLASRNTEIDVLLRTPGAAATPALLQGKSRMMYEFDAYVHRAPSPLWQLLGFGSPGFAVYVKSFPHPPTVTDLKSVRRAVEDVSAATKVPPSRVIALWREEGDAKLDDDAYSFVTQEVVATRRLGTTLSCSLQSIAETADGTYDFIPFIPELGSGYAAPAQATSTTTPGS